MTTTNHGKMTSPKNSIGAAYEDMVYRDSTDDGFDADIIDEFD